jgi:membrane fusion protein, adhesin transport system
VAQAEVLRVQRLVSDAESNAANRQNRYLQEARTEVAKARDDLGQVEQLYAQRVQVLENLVLKAPVAGIVKNVKITTTGGVLRPGDELLQIVPTNDKLVVEAKVRPSDIGLLRPGLPATIKFDAYDYTMYGSVTGKVSYISADTMKEDSRAGEQVYYRVHVETDTPAGEATTHLNKTIQVMPGMTAGIDIMTGQRTVLSYLLKPIRRTIDESLGER